VYAVSVASYLCIEQPVRRRRVLVANGRLLAVLALAMLLLLALAEVLIRNARPAAKVRPPMRLLLERIDLHPDLDRCTALATTALRNGELCRFGPDAESRPRVVAWGDSHAATLLSGLRTGGSRPWCGSGLRRTFLLSPLSGISSAMRRDRQVMDCEEFNEAMFEAIERVRPELVILAAHWSEPGDWFISGTDRAPQGMSIFGVGLERTIARIAKCRSPRVHGARRARAPVSGADCAAHRRQRGLDEELFTLTREEPRPARRVSSATFARSRRDTPSTSSTPRTRSAPRGAARSAMAGFPITGTPTISRCRARNA
jgi:hypothetical protein